jgi:hypothetical protein
MKTRKNYKYELYQIVKGQKIKYGSTPSINFARASVKRQRLKGFDAYWLPRIIK